MNFKCALITGASAGIGAATARAFAAQKVNLVLVARRLERLRDLAQEIEKEYGVQVKTAALDVRDLGALKRIPDLDKIDILVNNAGLARGADKFQDAKLEDLEEMMATNVNGLIRVTREVLPHMIKNGRGHIVNLGSVAGRWVYPGGAGYCASKFAVRAISEGLRMDLLGTPIRVTNIEPGMVETEFSEVRFQNKDKAKSVYKGMTPLTPEDIAETIVWSVSRPAHVNIQELVIFPTDQGAIQHVHRR
jgi:3-hydroxy acid dehydrogenase / malonic semialdehyde reductase